MARFRKGDVVRCVDAVGSFWLRRGAVYTVDGGKRWRHGYRVLLKELSGNGEWDETRFELVQATATTGEARKACGQAAAARHAGSEWTARAIAALKQFCLDNYNRGVTRVTLDEFRAADRVEEPESANAWGSLPRTAAKLGFLRDTGSTVKAARAKAHARLVKVWAIQPRAL
ncbi:hypothetical protein [Pandoraea sputorum]|uniref:hypothetical protein n=1 Tax=Pandoraea sputorum TaxID=93222 RepID=UPI002F3FC598